jgi:uncharacterized protein (DUF302 family)
MKAEQQIKTAQIQVQRVTITSSEPFRSVVARLDAAIGRPDMKVFTKDMVGAKTIVDLERIVKGAIGVSGLMEFARFDIGLVLRKAHGDAAPQSLRLVIGNPLIMKQMTEHVPDAASYAPVTILIDERDNKVHLSYDRMASLLAPYRNNEASEVASDLDSKIEALLMAAAA